MHKAPEFPGALLPGPLPGLSPGPVGGEGGRGGLQLPSSPQLDFSRLRREGRLSAFPLGGYDRPNYFSRIVPVEWRNMHLVILFSKIIDHIVNLEMILSFSNEHTQSAKRDLQMCYYKWQGNIASTLLSIIFLHNQSHFIVFDFKMKSLSIIVFYFCRRILVDGLTFEPSSLAPLKRKKMKI